ncbi:hypothetical protein JJE66_34815 [Bradyrhizobium diazoefficiens]|nr:hypothetical protein [Bradyrhizobium diazoefficiens]MBK3666373.1 hypothetical protein [Bradyrhizobium diazoefficiens]
MPAAWQLSCTASPNLQSGKYPEVYRAESEDLRLWRPEVWTRTVGIA